MPIIVVIKKKQCNGIKKSPEKSAQRAELQICMHVDMYVILKCMQACREQAKFNRFHSCKFSQVKSQPILQKLYNKFHMQYKNFFFPKFSIKYLIDYCKNRLVESHNRVSKSVHSINLWWL